MPARRGAPRARRTSAPISPRASEVIALTRAVRANTGTPTRWGAWPGGWPEDIESALVDAVFSANAIYTTKAGRGILALVLSWRAKRVRTTYTASALESEIAASGAAAWAAAFGNRQPSPGRRAQDPGGASKAATVCEAAGRLRGMGITKAIDITAANSAGVKRTLRTVRGIGDATSNYVLMLLGKPGVKPDRMILRYLARVLGRVLSTKEAEALVSAAAVALGVEPHELDHVIWKFERGR